MFAVNASITVVLSFVSCSSRWCGRPEPGTDEPGGGAVSPGQRGSVRSGHRPHHEHHQRPSLPGEHPPRHRLAGRWKHHHPGRLLSLRVHTVARGGRNIYITVP